MSSRYVIYEAPAFTAIRDSYSDNPCDLLVTIHTRYKDHNGQWKFYTSQQIKERTQRIMDIFNKSERH